MKKYLFSLIILTGFLTSSKVSGQNEAGRITVTPTVYTVEDRVKITIDLTGTVMAGEQNVYIWLFENGGAGNSIVNTDWANSPETAKFTKVGDLFEFSFVPIEQWPSAIPGNLKTFQFLTKTKTGSKQTKDSPAFTYEPLVFQDTTYVTFPDKPGQDDAITIYFSQKFSVDITEQRMTPLTASVTAYNEADGVVGSELSFPLKNEGPRKYSFIFLPAYNFGTVSGGIKKIKYVIKGNGKDENGNTIAVSGTPQEKLLLDLK